MNFSFVRRFAPSTLLAVPVLVFLGAVALFNRKPPVAVTYVPESLTTPEKAPHDDAANIFGPGWRTQYNYANRPNLEVGSRRAFINRVISDENRMREDRIPPKLHPDDAMKPYIAAEGQTLHYLTDEAGNTRVYNEAIPADRKEIRRQEEERKRWWAEVEREADEHNRKLFAPLRETRAQRIAKIQWRLNQAGPWRDVPRRGDHDYPITADPWERVEFRALRVRQDLEWPDGGEGGTFNWLQDGERSPISNGRAGPIQVMAEGWRSISLPKSVLMQHELKIVTAECNGQQVSAEVRFRPGPRSEHFTPEYDYLAGLLWRRNEKEAWRRFPAPGSKGYAAGVHVNETIWLKPLPSQPKLLFAHALRWQLGSDSEKSEYHGGTGFPVKIEERWAKAGNVVPLVVKCGNEITTLLKVLPPVPPSAANKVPWWQRKRKKLVTP